MDCKYDSRSLTRKWFPGIPSEYYVRREGNGAIGAGNLDIRIEDSSVAKLFIGRTMHGSWLRCSCRLHVVEWAGT